MPESLNHEIGRKKDEWRQEFRETRHEIARLQARLTELKRKLQAADEILFAAKQGGKKIVTGKFSNIGLTHALRKFFVEHRHSAHTISELKWQLEIGGMKTDARDLRANISMVCRRLQLDQFLSSEKRNGVLYYQMSAQLSKNLKEQAGAGKPTPAVQSIPK